jgi:hypothetical protein
MYATYIAGTNVATNGQALGADSNRDVVVWQIRIGAPTDGSTLTIYDVTNPVGGSTSNIVYKLTQPTAAAGKDWVRDVVFPKGLPLRMGGNVVIDATNNVTVLWDYLDEGDQ